MNIHLGSQTSISFPTRSLTCIWWQIEVEDGNDSDEDTRHDNVKHIKHGLSLDDQVERDVLIQVITHILPRNLVTDVPFSALWVGKRQNHVKKKKQMC